MGCLFIFKMLLPDKRRVLKLWQISFFFLWFMIILYLISIGLLQGKKDFFGNFYRCSFNIETSDSFWVNFCVWYDVRLWFRFFFLIWITNRFSIICGKVYTCPIELLDIFVKVHIIRPISRHSICFKLSVFFPMPTPHSTDYGSFITVLEFK